MEPMKPMAPMRPMEPMKPMTPMKRMEPMKAWWPSDLGQPSTAGAQNDMRYAFFPDRRRLLIEQDGRLTTYDTGDHMISGVAQQQSHSRSLTFSSQSGPVDLSQLKTVG